MRSTAAIDVLIDSRKAGVRIYRRNGMKLETEPAAVAGTIELRSIGLMMSFDDIHEDVNLANLDIRAEQA